MGIVSELLGNASEVDTATLKGELKDMLVKGERFERAYSVLRDMIVFTNKRLIMVDKQGLTGRKVSFLSVPYASIVRFSVETAGTLDLDAELKVWVTGGGLIVKRFNRQIDIFEVQRVLSDHVL